MITLPCLFLGVLDYIFWKSFPPIALDNDLTYSGKCKEHLPTHLIFTLSLHDFQPSIPNAKPETHYNIHIQ